MTSPTPRDAIDRADFFLDLSRKCSGDERNEFEAFMEASIIFARAALHRLKTKYENHTDWKPWWENLLNNQTVNFFRNERDHILKVGPPKVGQIVKIGSPPAQKASKLYYYEEPKIPATITIEKHLEEMKQLINFADKAFAN